MQPISHEDLDPVLPASFFPQIVQVEDPILQFPEFWAMDDVEYEEAA